MTLLVEYETLVGGGEEIHRVVWDGPYLTVKTRGGNRVLVAPNGETVMHVSDLDESYRIQGEVRFG